MRKPFSEDFVTTQKFGENPDMYEQFGLLGHNGIDFGLPTGTKVLAPHAGKIIEATLDPQGYGLYLKIENDKEGSVLAHLREFRVGVGDIVLENQLVGYSDNSGNSTGPHLHWGYYLFPRDRQNGYAGFINQESLITNSGVTVAVEDAIFKELVRKSTITDRVASKLNVENSETIILGELDKLISYEDAVVQKDKQLSEDNQKIEELEKKLQDLTSINESLLVENADIKSQVNKNSETISKQKIDIGTMAVQIEDLKKGLNQPVYMGIKKWLIDVINKFL